MAVSGFDHGRSILATAPGRAPRPRSAAATVDGERITNSCRRDLSDDVGLVLVAVFLEHPKQATRKVNRAQWQRDSHRNAIAISQEHLGPSHCESAGV